MRVHRLERADLGTKKETVMSKAGMFMLAAALLLPTGCQSFQEKVRSMGYVPEPQPRPVSLCTEKLGGIYRLEKTGDGSIKRIPVVRKTRAEVPVPPHGITWTFRETSTLGLDFAYLGVSTTPVDRSPAATPAPASESSDVVKVVGDRLGGG